MQKGICRRSVRGCVRGREICRAKALRGGWGVASVRNSRGRGASNGRVPIAQNVQRRAACLADAVVRIIACRRKARRRGGFHFKVHRGRARVLVRRRFTSGCRRFSRLSARAGIASHLIQRVMSIAVSQSLPTRIRLMIVGTSGVALVLACVIFLAWRRCGISAGCRRT